MNSVALSRKESDCEACASLGGRKCGVKSARASSRLVRAGRTRL